MNHNPHNFKVYDTVLLDGLQEVVITYMTPSKVFCHVYAVEDENKYTWDVMTSRLTPLKPNL